MTDRVALRAGVPPFYVMDVWLAAAERQRTHGDLVNLSAGQPSAGAPEPVRAAAAAALHLNQLGYSVALGIPELRDAIAADYQRRHGITVEPDAVVITTGSSGGFLLAFLACFDAGDRVAMASPGYPCYRNILSALGCEVVEIPCGPQTRFQPTAQMLAEIDPPLRGVVVASPANPTGTVIPPEELAAIASWCDASDVRLISDEVYHGLVYQGAPQTSCAWQTSRNAVVVNSFSKYYAMTGWRLGWLLVPTVLRRAVDCLTGNFTICPPVLSQIAAVSAFTPEATAEADGNLASYDQPLAVAGRSASHRHRPAGTHRRRILRLRRRLGLHQRFAGLLLKVAGRHRCCDRTRNRFRHRTGGFVCSDIVCRAKRRHRRSLTAHRLLAAEPIARRCASRARRARRYLPR
ncbi:aspartate aminotransferase [Mycobacterium tuberculosis]|nr:aspartate aminotransferase [Mycobacterium tuberculosis]